MPVKINLIHLQRGAQSLVGEIPVADLELGPDDELVHCRQPLRYDLTAELVGEGVLVRGSVEMELELECARCLRPFKKTIELPDYGAHLSLEGEDSVPTLDDSIDLTPFLREDIMLDLPRHPLCQVDCAGLAPTGEIEAVEGGSGGNAWSELEKLKFDKE